MMRLLALVLVVGLFVTTATSTAAPTADQKKTKEALRELQDFIGGWKGNGQTKTRPGPRDPFWSETVRWSWKFKGDDCWLTVDFAGGKFLKGAELRYLVKTKKYQLTGTPVEGKDKLVFEGALNDDKLVLERTDPKTKAVLRITMNLAAEGIRLIYRVERKPGTLWNLEYMVATTKEGEALAGKAAKGPECVVSGGKGTMTVSYNGETFWVCCTGCRDAFNENPKKYVDEFKKAHGKK
jgi:YHS domain-containing protein